MNAVLCLKKPDILKTLIQVCSVLQGQSWDIDSNKPTLPVNELEMMLLTIGVESDFVHRTQIGGGPAVGLCGMEPATALDTFRWLEDKPEAWGRLTTIWLGLRSVPFFTPRIDEVSEHLRLSDPFALGLERLHYKMFEEVFPDSLSDQARYWKQYWNTERGAGSVTEAIQKWDRHKCDKLMKLALKYCYLRGSDGGPRIAYERQR